jgi:hypothetical protein
MIRNDTVVGAIGGVATGWARPDSSRAVGLEAAASSPFRRAASAPELHL